MATTPETTAENKRRFLEEYLEKYGNVAAASKVVGINRRTYYAWREADPEFALAIDDALEDVKDNLESQLILVGTGAKKGNPIGLIAVLNARAKDRGYSRHEISGPNSGAIVFEVVNLASGAKGTDPCKVSAP
jgi:hypothetical protein